MSKEAISGKELVKELAKQGKKIKFSDRKEVEILKDTKFYKKGQVINPHVTVADYLIEKKVAKETK